MAAAPRGIALPLRSRGHHKVPWLVRDFFIGINAKLESIYFFSGTYDLNIQESPEMKADRL